MGLWKRPKRGRRARARGGPPGPVLEVLELEPRVVLYSVSGNAWPHPELVTISFMPDGTNLGGTTSNLVSKFNAKFKNAATWQNQILKAAQQWAQQTNLNFAVVADNGAASGSGSYQQGDPGFGDIRVGGYNFGNASLALAYMPPPVNNYSLAGDVSLNTGQTFNIGSNYDLFTVAVHEVGHALGLNHSTTTSAVMYSTYSGVMTGLNADDVAGIRQIYSSGAARAPDAYDAAAANGSFTAATDVSAQINATSKTALLTNLDVTATTDLDYYKFTAPAGCTSSLTVTVRSSGLSLLAPTLAVYNSSQKQLKSASGAGKYGTTLTVTVTGVSAGQTYYVKVAGADATAFGTGRYALTLNMGTGSSPVVPLPNTRTPNGSPLSSGGGTALFEETSPEMDVYWPAPWLAESFPGNADPSPPTAGPPTHGRGNPEPGPGSRGNAGAVPEVLFSLGTDGAVFPPEAGGTPFGSEAGPPDGARPTEVELPAAPPPAASSEPPAGPEDLPHGPDWRAACDLCFTDFGWLTFPSNLGQAQSPISP